MQLEKARVRRSRLGNLLASRRKMKERKRKGKSMNSCSTLASRLGMFVKVVATLISKPVKIRKLLDPFSRRRRSSCFLGPRYVFLYTSSRLFSNLFSVTEVNFGLVQVEILETEPFPEIWDMN